MPVAKKPKTFVKKDDLAEALQNTCPDHYTCQSCKDLPKLSLLLQAAGEGLISAEQLKTTYPTQTSVIKCYLRTHVKDPTLLEVVDEYVLAISKLHRRGSIIANLLIQQELSRADVQPEDRLPRSIFVSDSAFQLATKYDKLKHCFFPERYIVGKTTTLDPAVQGILDDYADALQHLLPTAWQETAALGIWDQALNNLGSTYVGNIKVQIMTHFVRRLDKYAATTLVLDEGTPRAEFCSSLKFKVRPLTIHDNDFQLLTDMRTLRGAENATVWASKELEFSKALFNMHCFLVLKDCGDTFLPVGKRGRKYAYIDHKISEGLRRVAAARAAAARGVKRPRFDASDAILGITRDSFNSMRKEVRKSCQARSKARNQSAGAKKNKRWNRVGHGSMPKDARVLTLLTDGIGLSITLERPARSIPEARKAAPQQVAAARSQDQRLDFVGVDTGRAKIATFAHEGGGAAGERRSQGTLTRSNYYWQMHDKSHKKWCQQRAAQPGVAAALQGLAVAGAMTGRDSSSWRLVLEAEAQHWGVLEEEYYKSVDYAVWKMRLYRLKRASLDRFCNTMLKCGDEKQPLVLGVGNGKFPATGRGEQAVPTTAFDRAVLRAVRRSPRQVLRLKVDEFRTTVACHKCHQRNEAATKESGGRSRRLRQCGNCHSETSANGRYKVDRDYNAAKNMVLLAKCLYFGEERPAAFSRGQALPAAHAAA